MARILVVSNLFPPDARGGYELACGDVVRRWRDAGHTVEVLSGSGGELPLTSVHGAVPPPLKRVGIERRANRVLRAALGREPDVVSVWNMAGLSMTLLTTLDRSPVPVVYVLADAWPLRSPPTDPWLTAVKRLPRLARLAGRAANIPTSVPALGPSGRWVFCSRSLHDEVVAAVPEHGPFADSSVVPLGVDTTDFPIAPEADERPWRGRLLFVGRLDAVKGIDTLLRAMALLPPETTLEVLGPAEEHHVERIRALIDELGIGDRVEVASAARDELAARYRGSDVCVFASEWAEPFGIVPLEAMACATPVVATGVGGSADYLRDGTNSLLFRPGDPADLAAAVLRLAGDAPLRHRLATAGLATAAGYTTERLAGDLLDLHLEVADRA